MKICKKCGHLNADTYEICDECGARLTVPAKPKKKKPKYVGKNYTFLYKKEDIMSNRTICILSCIPPLFFLPIIFCPKSLYGKFWANENLIVFLYTVTAILANLMIQMMSYALTIALGWMLLFKILFIVVKIAFLIATIIFEILLIVSAFIATLQNQARELPFIGYINLINIDDIEY